MSNKMEMDELINLANELGSDIINKGLTGLDIGQYIKPIELKAIIADYLFKKFEFTNELDYFSQKHNTQFQAVFCESCGKHTTLSNAKNSDDNRECFSGGWVQDNSDWLCIDCYEQKHQLALSDEDFQKVQRRLTSAKEFRQAVYAMDNGACVYCGEKLSFVEFEIDHMRPISLSGETNIDNCVASCTKCNRSKRDKLLEAIDMELTYGRFMGNQTEVEGNYEIRTD